MKKKKTILKKTRKIISSKTVFEEGLERMRYLFDEFKNIIVCFSGGKDSTVTLELALMVAKERDYGPLKVLFLDQESERTATVDYVREVMSRAEVEPMWLQIPFTLYNSTSFSDNRLRCRDESPDIKRIRDKEAESIKDNVYGTDRFADLFGKIATHHFSGESFCYLAGVRCEESPRRYMGLTQQQTYKRITRGKKLDDKKHFTFYPLYDRTYIDIWKAIHDHDRNYNKLYDYQYRYGVNVNGMRVSSLIHETAITALFYLPEVDRDLYNKLCDRTPGISTANNMNQSDFIPKKLPFMFESRIEYRDYLLEKLIQDPVVIKNLTKAFAEHDAKLEPYPDLHMKTCRKHIASIVTNDIDLTKIKSLDTGGINKFLKEKKIEAEIDEEQDNI